MEYVAIRSAIVNLEVGVVNIWVLAQEAVLGPIWDLVLSWPEVRIRRMEDLPTSVYGHQVNQLAHVSDRVKLGVVYKEGGIYMDYNLIGLRSSSGGIYMNYNLIGLRSSSGVLDDAATKSSLMAREANVVRSTVLQIQHISRRCCKL